MNRPSDQEGFEFGNHSVFDERTRAGDDPSNIQPPNLFRHSIIEEWLQGRCGFHAHITLARPKLHLDAGHYCARFERPTEALLRKNANVAVGGNLRFDRSDVASDREESAVLVPIGYGSEVSKGLGTRTLPAGIWLQRLDDCAHATGDAGHPVPHSGQRIDTLSPLSPDELSARIRDWELDLLLLFLPNGPTQHPHHMVEGGSELVGGLANANNEHRWRRLDTDDPDSKRRSAAMVLTLSPMSVELRFAEELIADALSHANVLTRPSELPHDVVELVGHWLDRR
jgi:hypothetical protein